MMVLKLCYQVHLFDYYCSKLHFPYLFFWVLLYQLQSLIFHHFAIEAFKFHGVFLIENLNSSGFLRLLLGSLISFEFARNCSNQFRPFKVNGLLLSSGCLKNYKHQFGQAWALTLLSFFVSDHCYYESFYLQKIYWHHCQTYFAALAPHSFIVPYFSY